MDVGVDQAGREAPTGGGERRDLGPARRRGPGGRLGDRGVPHRDEAAVEHEAGARVGPRWIAGPGPRVADEESRAHARSTTGLTRAPTPSISIVTSSPGSSGPTPAGVPVEITSPGSSVITFEM